MDTIVFDPAGPALFAEVRCGFANPGSYSLILWERDSNQKAMPDRFGNFINADDDTYPLGDPPLANDGRIVESFVSISPPSGFQDYAASLHIHQGTRELGATAVSGQSDAPTVTLDLFVLLRAGV